MRYDYLIVGSGLFGGRLAQYRYYDMAPVIEQALMAARCEINCP